MRKDIFIIVTLLFALSANIATAQTCESAESQTDSTNIALKEVTITADRIRLSTEGIKYFPTKTQKRLAADAVTLLRLMALPQLDINPATGMVNNNFGSSVAIYIDFMKASEYDAKVLNPEDVQTIEYYDLPTDPRFSGEQAVLNFVMRHYQWGGYSRVNLEGTLGRERNAHMDLYSRFVNGKLSYELFTTGNIGRDKTGEDATAFYDGVVFDGVPYERIVRLVSTNTVDKTRGAGVTGRITYRSRDFFSRLSVGFSHARPITEQHGVETYRPAVVSGSELLYKSFSVNNYPSLSGENQLKLNKNMVTLNYHFGFGNNRVRSDYDYAENNFFDKTHESGFKYSIRGGYTQYLSRGSRLFFNAFTSGDKFKTDYYGTFSSAQRLTKNQTGFSLTYAYYWKRELSLSAKGGATVSSIDVNRTGSRSQWTPEFQLSANWLIDSQNSLRLTAYSSSIPPESTATNTVVKEIDEITWSVGNPDLDIMRNYTFSLSYNRNFSDRLTLNAWGRYILIDDRITPIYIPAPDGRNGLAITYANTKNYQMYDAGMSITWRPFSPALSLQGRLYWYAARIRGIYHDENNCFATKFTATWTANILALQAWWQSPTRYLHDGGRMKKRQDYGISTSLTLGDLKMSLFALNWFNTAKSYRAFLDTTHYSGHSEHFGGEGCRSFGINISLTIGYGKKIDREDEINGTATGESAIIHR